MNSLSAYRLEQMLELSWIVFWIIYGIICLICAVGSAYLAGVKNRDVGGFFFVGLIFGLFGLIIAAGVPTRGHNLQGHSPTLPSINGEINPKLGNVAPQQGLKNDSGRKDNKDLVYVILILAALISVFAIAYNFSG